MNINSEYPLVSIAIITYNQKEFLRECIESCLVQDYINFEIIVADDASSDGTQDMLREYEAQYPNKFILRLAEKNKGITPNSNAAHFACSGKYIAWMGGDDLMLPGKISKQVQLMESNSNYTICYHNLDVFDSSTNKTLWFYNSKNKISGDIKMQIRHGVFNGACSNMIRASKAPKNGFNANIPVASDWLYWIETLENGGTIEYIDEVLGRYRRHYDNITKKSTNINQNDLDHLITCQILIKKFPCYFNEIMHAYSRALIGIRHKVSSYFSILLKSIILHPSKKAIGALIIYLISFGQIKV